MTLKDGVMRFISVIAALMALLGSAQAAIIQIDFNEPITRVVGNPFGHDLMLGMSVDGSFQYDTSIPCNRCAGPAGPTANSATFPGTTPNGFLITVGGLTVQSSNYILDSVNDVENFGGSDIFRAFVNSLTGDFRANGTQSVGFAELIVADTQEMMFADNTDVNSLPNLAQIALADVYFGLFGTDQFNFVEFGSVNSIPIPPSLPMFPRAV